MGPSIDCIMYFIFHCSLLKTHCIFDSRKSCQTHIPVHPPNSWQSHICCRLKFPMLCSLSLSYVMNLMNFLLIFLGPGYDLYDNYCFVV